MDSRPSFAEIDLSALASNYRTIQSSLPADTGIMAVVKADAYGHGFMDIARKLESLDVAAFGVAFLAEGIQLRKSGIDRPVLVLGGIYPGQERKCIGYNLSTIVFDIEQARNLDRAAAALYRKARVHMKIDTGMGRLGISIAKAPAFIEELKNLRNIELEGVISHFASADELDEGGAHFTAGQVEHFNAVLTEIHRQGFHPRYIHLANSAAAFTLSLPACNLVRPGITLYGALPSPDFAGKLNLKPVMRVKSKVAMLKEVEAGATVSYARRYVAKSRRLIASVPIGYADGYPRALTGKGEALIRGMRATVAGTVCMDWVMFDVTDIPGVRAGDEVILLGCDDSGNCILAEELAAKAGTIPYEIFCGISKRIPRVYLG